MTINRKVTGLALLSVVLVATIAGGILLAAHASASALTDDYTATDLTQLSNAADPNSTAIMTGDTSCIFGPGFGGPMGFGRHGGFGGHGIGFSFGPIEVSDEYEAAVTTILEADTDVQQLLANGYNVTRIMPMIKTVIDAEGNVTAKATNATVILKKDTTGLAFVSVDLDQDAVTQIVTYTRTVIDKTTSSTADANQ